MKQRMVRIALCTLTVALTAIFPSRTNRPAAEPLTLYKAANIATARGNLDRYDWARDIVNGWERNVEHIMAQDSTWIAEMIDPLTPWPLYGQNCPHCVGKKSSMGETGIYAWDINDPDRITCKHCGTVYPNPDYPETGSMTCPNMGQTFTFYLTEGERANPDDTGGKHAFRWAAWPVHTSFSGVIRFYKQSYCVSKIVPLAKLYALTGDIAYAEKAALIMDITAQRYPDWMYHSYNGTYADMPPGLAAEEMGRHHPNGRFPKELIVNAFNLHVDGEYATLNNGFWGAGRFGCSGSDGRYVLQWAVAWDLIRDARRSDGSRLWPVEAERRIINDLIIAGCDDSENYQHINNKCGPARAASAAVGILFNRPRSVRRAIDGFEALLHESFHFDGFCRETPSYSQMHLNLMGEIPEILRGYTDPDGLSAPPGGLYSDYDPFRENDRYRLALLAMARMLDMNYKYPVIGDTHYGSGIPADFVETLVSHYGPRYAALLEQALDAPLAEKGSEYALWNRPPGISPDPHDVLKRRTEWFPGWHVGVLRGGPASDSTALYFNANDAGTAHRHYDCLSISYYAGGRELASDRGYIWDDARNAWTKSTLAHNIVTVDGVSQTDKHRDSTLDLFGSSPLVEVVQASAGAYTVCDEYRRTCALVKISDESTYAVDFFRVRGGKLHQYCFNCNGTFAGMRGATPTASGRTFKWLDNIRSDTPSYPFSATWEDGGMRMDLIMLNPVDELLLADAPGWRSDRGEELNAPPIQQIIAEQSDPVTQRSHFAAVMVPYAKGTASPVSSVGGIANDWDSDVMAIQVRLQDRTDYIISAGNDTPRTYGPVTMAGRFGVASVDGHGRLIAAYLLDGTELTVGGAGVKLPAARTELAVTAVDGRTFTVAGAVPDSSSLAGGLLLAGDTGYEIESVDGDRITVREYPAIECGSVTIVHAGTFR